jgi:hypothetical protein
MRTTYVHKQSVHTCSSKEEKRSGFERVLAEALAVVLDTVWYPLLHILKVY